MRIRKIIPYKKLTNQIIKRDKKRTYVFFSGAFDVFHYAHFNALKKASELGDILVVQVDGNKLVKKRKGSSRPYFNESYRALIVASLVFVDYVFISNTPSESREKLRKIQPNIFVRAILPNESNGDREKRTRVLNKKSPRTTIVWLEQSDEISTTKIIAKVFRYRSQSMLNETMTEGGIL